VTPCPTIVIVSAAELTSLPELKDRSYLGAILVQPEGVYHTPFKKESAITNATSKSPETLLGVAMVIPASPIDISLAVL
jgi:hypothetical protein